MNFIEIFQSLGSNIWLYGGAFLLVLSVLVFIHEWGHYIVARMCGVHVEIFSIGFGPEIFGFNDKRGMRWKFSIIPLGGYVKMYGDTDPASAGQEDAEAIPEDRKSEAFFAKSVAQRAAIVFAGPAINYIFAITVMAALFAFNGQPLTPARVGAVIEGSAAQEAGFQPHDEVLSIDGTEIRSFEDVRRAMLVGLDEERVFSVLRGTEELDLTALPKKTEQEDRFGFKSSRGFLGIVSPQHGLAFQHILRVDGKDVTEDTVRDVLRSKLDTSFWIDVKKGEDDFDRFYTTPFTEMNPDFDSADYLVLSQGAAEVFIKYSPIEAVTHAVTETWDITTSTLHAIGQMFTGTRSPSELGGMIRIGTMAGDVAQRGAIALLMFAALLSINLGLINLFPIPMLDGGHLVFYALEAVRGKPVSEKVQDYAFRAGFGILILLMAFANINDLVQMFL